MPKRTFLFVAISLIIIFPFSASAQDRGDEYRTVVPDPEFGSGWLHNLFFGYNWRELWTTPVRVKTLDLSTFDGGIRPYKKGGGMQTLSLRLRSGSGKIFKFRSIRKDPSKVLSPVFRESIVADVLKDQISSSNPVAPVLVVPLLDAVEILNSPPEIYYMPDDSALGEFRGEFGGMLGMLELHPADEEDDVPGIQGADKIEGTLELWERLEDKRSERMDPAAFLTARLVDILIGDWDRHTDQWKWARFKIEEEKIWRPIPRDRDQAFSRFTGLFPSIATTLVHQLNHFDEDYPSIRDLTWNGRYMDRRILPELSRASWDSITLSVQKRITDEVINEAVSLYPLEYDSKYREELSEDLKIRRHNLTEASDEYFKLINSVIDIYGSRKDDFIEVFRRSDENTEIIIYNRDPDTGDSKERKRFYKNIDNNITGEVRIYLLGGDDKVILRGEVDESPLIRIVAGDGLDEIIDSSRVNGYFLCVTPFSSAENKTYIYDSDIDTKITCGAGTLLDPESVYIPEDLAGKYEPPLPDRGSDWYLFPNAGFNGDDGFLIGAYFIYQKYGFRHDPYQSEINTSLLYATNPNNAALEFNGFFNSFLGKNDLLLEVIASGLTFTKYFGYGNETPFDSELEELGYYRLERQFLSIKPMLNFSLGNALSAAFGFSMEHSDTELVNDTLLFGFPYGGYGINGMNLAGIHGQMIFDTRDNGRNAYHGFYLKAEGSYYPEIIDSESDFARALFDIRAYYTIEAPAAVTFALRGGGGRVWGRYPFTKGIFLGGSGNLRGYSRERFTGESGLFGQAEVRGFLTNLNLIIIGRLGLSAFIETGRVFTDGGDSKLWHPSVGGGIWMTYLDRTLNLSVNFAHSNEGDILYFQTSMSF